MNIKSYLPPSACTGSCNMRSCEMGSGRYSEHNGQGTPMQADMIAPRIEHRAMLQMCRHYSRGTPAQADMPAARIVQRPMFRK